MASKPKYAVVLRTYGSREEDVRNKAGTIFSIDGPHKDDPKNMRSISFPRFRQLQEARLVKPWEKGDPIPGPRDARPPATPLNKMEPDSVPQPVTGAMIREKARARDRVASSRMTGNDESPQEPRPMSDRIGSRTGEGKSPSSSPPGLAQVASTLRARGTRTGSNGSSSTIRGDSPPGPDSSMPVTPIGGDSTSTESGPLSEEVL